MHANEFSLSNAVGGSGGTYRLNQDGTLSRRALRALIDAPFGGWGFSGPAALPAMDQWTYVRRIAHDAGISPLEVRQ